MHMQGSKRGKKKEFEESDLHGIHWDDMKRLRLDIGESDVSVTSDSITLILEQDNTPVQQVSTVVKRQASWE